MGNYRKNWIWSFTLLRERIMRFTGSTCTVISPS